MAAKKARRFRVSGVDQNGDVLAFESDNRARAKAQLDRYLQELKEVEWKTQRWL